MEGDCSLESGLLSSMLALRTRFTRNLPLRVNELLLSVETLNLPFLVKELEFDSPTDA